jgi:fructose-1-phosphate kinase PfkB-like protein
VKPNQQEAEAWSGKTIDGARSAESTLMQLFEAGALAGAISLGEHGLVCSAANQTGVTVSAKGPALKPRSTVGSGDSSLAGFAFAASQGLSLAESVRLAAACGAANCLAEGPGLARAEDIKRLKREIQVETLQ